VKVAITGATGFIGRELVFKHLECGNSVKILTRKNKDQLTFPVEVQVVNGDLSDAGDSLPSFVKGVDVLYHCAAEILDESKMFKINVIGTQNLVNASTGIIKHWVQLSSTGVYGKIKSGLITERIHPYPYNNYEITKLKSDEIVEKAGLDNKFTYTILRPSNVFGKGMKNQSLLQMIKIIDKGFFAFIGKEGASANFIPVENVVTALVLCGQAQNAKGKTYILSDRVTIELFVSTICNALNKPIPKIRLSKYLVKLFTAVGQYIPHYPLTSSRIEALTNSHVYSPELIMNELNYHHDLTLEEGIFKLVQYYKSMKKF
jgi:nucleoside-diphosphate-sugar epimerase